MNKYTLQQRKRIIFTFITQQVKQGERIDTYLVKVAKDGFSGWNFEYLIKSISTYFIEVGHFREDQLPEVLDFELFKTETI